MKINAYSHTRNWLLLYLALVLLTTAVAYLFVYIDVTGTLSALHSIDGGGAESGSLIAGLKHRLLFILAGGGIGCTILGLIWVSIATRRIEQPVHTIATAMKKLAKGQLNETVVVETSDELEQIGASINELAANLQELLLYIWKQTGQCHTLLDQVHSTPDLQNHKRLSIESLGHLKQLSAAIDDLREMAKAYVFYDVSIDGIHTHAISELGDGAATSELTRNYN